MIFILKIHIDYYLGMYNYTKYVDWLPIQLYKYIISRKFNIHIYNNSPIPTALFCTPNKKIHIKNKPNRASIAVALVPACASCQYSATGNFLSFSSKWGDVTGDGWGSVGLERVLRRSFSILQKKRWNKFMDFRFQLLEDFTNCARKKHTCPVLLF